MSNTAASTIPAGWSQVPQQQNETSNITNIQYNGRDTTKDESQYARNILSAWTTSSKGQIDEVIGVTKYTQKILLKVYDRFYPYQFVQVALNGAQASGTQIVSWITYPSWDSLNIQTLTTVGTNSTAVISYSTGGDLAALSGVTAINIKGVKPVALNSTDIALNANATVNLTNGWFGIHTKAFPNLNDGSPFKADTLRLKVGDSFNYTVGYKVFANSASTTPTASASGFGKFTILDEAV